MLHSATRILAALITYLKYDKIQKIQYPVDNITQDKKFQACKNRLEIL